VIAASSKNRWIRHRAALAILGESDADPSQTLESFLATFDAEDAYGVAQKFLEYHGLSGLWYRFLEPQVASHARVSAFADALRPSYLAAVVQQRLQERVMSQVAAALDRHGIEFVFMKTAGLRAELYDEPGLRPSTDVDLLVCPEDRFRVFDAFDEIGAIAYESTAESEHEKTYAFNKVDLDLHWDVLAPGRLMPSYVRELMVRRVRTNIGWRPSDTDCAFIAFVHPAFAKHVCSRHMGLNRVADTQRLFTRLSVNALELSEKLKRNGVFTGAKTSIYWISKIIKNDSLARYNSDFNVCIDSLKFWYLRQWIDRNWPDFWVERNRVFLQLAFTAWLHDSPRHFLRVVRARFASRRSERAPQTQWAIHR
jgi:hypothetical protein